MKPGDGFRSGYLAIVGRPNTGKSTLVNALVGEKISIVTSKPQTTRHRILGVLTGERYQLMLVDTPGLHGGSGKLLNRTMNRAAVGSLADADAVLFLVEATGWSSGDDYVLERIRQLRCPCLLVPNKVDLVKPRSRLLPFIERCTQRHDFSEIIPVSATRGQNLDRLLDTVLNYIPEGDMLFPADATTDRNIEFRIAEIVREKLMQCLHQEVPYGLAVEVNQLQVRGELMLVDMIIWVDRESHSGIVVGQGGARIKRVGTEARLELETTFGRKFHLQTRVKARQNWSDSARALQQLGFEIRK